jgi:ubiquinone/menaquinone biosynthesis C-methylase UbiE
MTASNPCFEYPLGSTDAEHERLIRQAQWVNPHTERCFREAGIGRDYRVLDLGSGVGDVALLLARLVGPTGEVRGVERDTRSIGRARKRVADAGLRNVTFTPCDISQISGDKPFDAAVGRYILPFLPDPVSVLRSLSQLVHSGGLLAFQEPDLDSFVEQCRRLPLWFAGASLMLETFQRSGTNLNLGPKLSQIFQKAGLPAPKTRRDTLFGSEQWVPDCLQSLRPRIAELKISTEALGDFETLSERLRAEVRAFKTTAPVPDLISAWSRTPEIAASR